MKSFIEKTGERPFISLNVKEIKKKNILKMWLKKKRNSLAIFPYNEY